MPYVPNRAAWFTTAYTLAAGCAGAGLGYLIGLPIYPLVGPAICISLLGLTGLRLDVVGPVRDVAFIVLGISMGAGMTPDALDAMQRWPLAFLVLGLALVATVLACRVLLTRLFGYHPLDALLAASPGHVSFVISIGASMSRDVTPVAIVQSLRLLILTICVPFLAISFGIEIPASAMSGGQLLTMTGFVLIALGACITAVVFQRLKVPAAVLIAAMVVSAVAHLTGWAEGTLPNGLVFPSYIILGTMIGTRFSGVRLSALRNCLAAGLTNTLLTILIAALAAYPVAMLLGMELAHVLVAFAPGGIETMIALGLVLGAQPGFVAACHVGRLFLLSVLVPFLLSRYEARHFCTPRDNSGH